MKTINFFIILIVLLPLKFRAQECVSYKCQELSGNEVVDDDVAFCVYRSYLRPDTVLIDDKICNKSKLFHSKKKIRIQKPESRVCRYNRRCFNLRGIKL